MLTDRPQFRFGESNAAATHAILTSSDQRVSTVPSRLKELSLDPPSARREHIVEERERRDPFSKYSVHTLPGYTGDIRCDAVCPRP